MDLLWQKEHTCESIIEQHLVKAGGVGLGSLYLSFLIHFTIDIHIIILQQYQYNTILHYGRCVK